MMRIKLSMADSTTKRPDIILRKKNADRVDLSRFNKNDDIHIMPEFKGEKVHDCCVHCWCEPEISFADGVKRTWTHRRTE